MWPGASPCCAKQRGLRKKNKYARDAGKDAALKIAIFQGFLPRRSGSLAAPGNFYGKKELGEDGEVLDRTLTYERAGEDLIVTLSAECGEQIGQFVEIPKE